MSVWSELSGTCRVAALADQRSRVWEPCEFCGAKVPSAKEHQDGMCAVLARYGLVYFIQAGEGGPVKIGFTRQPVSRRLIQLGTAAPFGLRLLLTIAGAPETERHLHRAYRDHHAHREWFDLERRVLTKLAAMQLDPAVVEEKRRFRVARLDDVPFAAPSIAFAEEPENA